MNSGVQVESMKPRHQKGENIVRESDRAPALFGVPNHSEYTDLLAMGRAAGTSCDYPRAIRCVDRAMRIRRVDLNVSLCSLKNSPWNKKQPYPDRCGDYG